MKPADSNGEDPTPRASGKRKVTKVPSSSGDDLKRKITKVPSSSTDELEKRLLLDNSGRMLVSAAMMPGI